MRTVHYYAYQSESGLFTSDAELHRFRSSADRRAWVERKPGLRGYTTFEELAEVTGIKRYNITKVGWVATDSHEVLVRESDQPTLRIARAEPTAPEPTAPEARCPELTLRGAIAGAVDVATAGGETWRVVWVSAAGTTFMTLEHAGRMTAVAFEGGLPIGEMRPVAAELIADSKHDRIAQRSKWLALRDSVRFEGLRQSKVA